MTRAARARVGAAVLAALAALAPHTFPHVALAQAGAPAAGPASAAWSAALDSFRTRLRAEVAFDDVGGVTAAVVVGDRLVWAEGFGWADRERRIPAGVETIYRIGSISKSFTAVAMMQLVAAGTLSLDRPVEQVLPAVRQLVGARSGAPPITFRQLASHTAGIIREPRLEGAAAGPIEGWEAKVLASIPATSFDTLPGARYAYSNIGFGVLGLAVARAAGTEFRDLVAREIFAPLGMRHSSFVVPPGDLRQLAVGYANRSDGRVDAEGPAREHRGRGYKVPNGGIYSTVGDLARFIAGMTGAMGDAMLAAEQRREMMRLQTPGNDSSGYGLGFTVRLDADGRRYVGHGGSVSGYTAHLIFEPESRIGVILLRNYNTGRTNLGGAAAWLARELVRSSQP